MPPIFAGIAAAIFAAIFLHALFSGRIMVARSFFRAHYAERRDNPVLYWFFTAMVGLIAVYGAGSLAEGLLPGLDLPWVESEQPGQPGGPSE